MNSLLEFFSVNKIAFTVLNYPISYLELVGTIFYLWSVWLIAQRKMLTWPIGIVSVLLFMLMFYQIRLYADTLEQAYYLGASLYGWWHWTQSQREEEQTLAVRYSEQREIAVVVAVTLVLGMTLGAVLTRVHSWLPTWFPEEASYPYLDAVTTVMSFTAMWLMARQRIESWIYWIIVDVAGIWLYYVKGVKFVALLYVVLLSLAINGFLSWQRSTQAEAAPVTS